MDLGSLRTSVPAVDTHVRWAQRPRSPVWRAHGDRFAAEAGWIQGRRGHV